MIRRAFQVSILAFALTGCATYGGYGYADGSFAGPYDGGYYAAPQEGNGDYYYDRPQVVINEYPGYFDAPYASYGFGFGYGPWGFGYDPWFLSPWWGFGWEGDGHHHHHHWPPGQGWTHDAQAGFAQQHNAARGSSRGGWSGRPMPHTPSH